jgi:hypothetical protein
MSFYNGKRWPDINHQLDGTNRSSVMLLVVCKWGQIGVNTHIVLGYAAAAPMNSVFARQVGQESNLQPAVLETQSGVSGSVARCRHMPLCPTLAVALCR